MKLKVIKDCYYITRGSELNNEYLTPEALYEQMTQLLVVGDIWETDDELPNCFVCTEGEWQSECSDGFWVYEDVKEFFEVIEE